MADPSAGERRYPVKVEFDHPPSSSRALAVLGILAPLKAIALLPVILLLYGLDFVLLPAVWFGYWAILFTGRPHAGLTKLIADIMRVRLQFIGWMASFADIYPYLGLGASRHPIALEVETAETRSRAWAIVGILLPIRLVLLLPHLVVLYILVLILFILVWIGYWIILFIGRYPLALFKFNTGIVRWQMRVSAWAYGLTDDYPPFSIF